MAAGEPAARIVVSVCTMLRPRGLSRLLDSLAEMDVPPGVGEVAVVVVDNDRAGSARSIVDERSDYPHRLVYVHEPRQGIPFARNAGVEAGLRWAVTGSPGAGDAVLDSIAFVDDDEWVSRGWLRHLHDVRRRTGAVVATGAVEPVFETSPPGWAVEGAFYERPRFPTGTEINYARTSNALVDARVFVEDGLRFQHLGMPGGEDTHLFNEIVQRGHRIVWVDEAVVFEEVPESRVAPRWLIARHYRYGLTRSASLRVSGGSPRRYARRATNGALTIARSALRLVLARSTAQRIGAAQEAALGAGLILGLVGARYDDYRTIHGS